MLLNISVVPMEQLDRIETVVNEILKELKSMSATVSANLLALQAQVTQNTTVEGSAITLIQGIAQQLTAALANSDDSALPALVTQLNTSATALASAITANTPSAPPAPTGATAASLAKR
jgi:hypothetical protein